MTFIAIIYIKSSYRYLLFAALGPAVVLARSLDGRSCGKVVKMLTDLYVPRFVSKPFLWDLV